MTIPGAGARAAPPALADPQRSARTARWLWLRARQCRAATSALHSFVADDRPDGAHIFCFSLYHMTEFSHNLLPIFNDYQVLVFSSDRPSARSRSRCGQRMPKRGAPRHRFAISLVETQRSRPSAAPRCSAFSSRSAAQLVSPWPSALPSEASSLSSRTLPRSGDARRRSALSCAPPSPSSSRSFSRYLLKSSLPLTMLKL